MPGARIISEFSAFKLSKIGSYHKTSVQAIGKRQIFEIPALRPSLIRTESGDISSF